MKKLWWKFRYAKRMYSVMSNSDRWGWLSDWRFCWGSAGVSLEWVIHTGEDWGCPCDAADEEISCWYD